MATDAYERLARHLSSLGMGLPYREGLVEILKENVSAEEAEVIVLLPTRVGPLQPRSVDEIAANCSLPRDELASILEGLADRGVVFSGKTEQGTTGYALQQVGFGFPQTFFWKGEDTPHARKMTKLLIKYFNRQVTTEAFGTAKTKPYRYIPAEKAISKEVQAVYPQHMMETVIQNAQVFAVAHCPCRVEAEFMGRGCDHPLEVCLKFDDMAQYLIDKGLGKQITRDEAREIIKQSAEAGLVHFVDNTAGEVKHNCNCCGCACWNVGTIRRRKIPRDVLMATYWLRETIEENCTGCGACIDVCPVDALTMEDDIAVVDADWCIGCGVCVPKCSFDAIRMVERTDREPMPQNFHQLHETILDEKGLK